MVWPRQASWKIHQIWIMKICLFQRNSHHWDFGCFCRDSRSQPPWARRMQHGDGFLMVSHVFCPCLPLFCRATSTRNLRDQRPCNKFPQPGAKQSWSQTQRGRGPGNSLQPGHRAQRGHGQRRAAKTEASMRDGWEKKTKAFSTSKGGNIGLFVWRRLNYW